MVWGPALPKSVPVQGLTRFEVTIRLQSIFSLLNPFEVTVVRTANDGNEINETGKDVSNDVLSTHK